MKPDRSLKSLNMKWLIMLVALDVLVVLLFVFPEAVTEGEIKRLAVVRGLITSVLPVVVLMLSGWISADAKASLAFWRIRHPLPGSEAFTRYGPADPRIDMVALKKHVGELPSDPGEQNKKWYRLYRMVERDPAVEEAQRMYLLFRDMCAVSVPLILLVPLGLYLLVGASATAALATAVLFIVQYLVVMVNSRNHGIRFVCNVLAIHCTRKIVTRASSTPGSVAAK